MVEGEFRGKRVTIYGMGLMGTSMAIGLSKKGYTICGVDIDRVSLDHSLKNNYIQRASEKLVGVLEDTDILIIGRYPSNIEEIAKEINTDNKGPLLVFDICGVKSSVVEVFENTLDSNIDFVGAHPMAGLEKVGGLHGDDKIFKGANFIITPSEKTSREGIKAVKKIADDLGFGRITEVSPRKHDDLIAFTSQLTHVIAVTLVNSDKNEDTKLFTGNSYRDLTRIAMINENLWSELFLGNKEALLEKIRDFKDELEDFERILENEDSERMKEIFRKSTKKRLEFQ